MRELGRCTCLPDASEPFTLDGVLNAMKDSMGKPIGKIHWVVTKAEEKILNGYGITSGYLVAEDLQKKERDQ